MITLMPEGGLCNRMRAIDSAIAVARAANHALQVIWTISGFPPPAQGFQLGCSFAELFEIPDGIRVCDVRLPFPAIFYHAYFVRSSDVRLFNSDLGSG